MAEDTRAQGRTIVRRFYELGVICFLVFLFFHLPVRETAADESDPQGPAELMTSASSISHVNSRGEKTFVAWALSFASQVDQASIVILLMLTDGNLPRVTRSNESFGSF